jgi:hypothetical protein
MAASELAELDTVRSLVRAADLTDEARHTVDYCLDRLPVLYGDFCRTCDSRHGDEIRRLVGGLLALADAPSAKSVTGELQALHERLGIPALKFAAPPKTTRKRKTV